MRGLADVLKAQNKLAEAEDFYRQALALELTGKDISGTSSTMEDLTGLLKSQGKPAELDRIFQDAITTHRNKGESAGLAMAMTHFGKWLVSEGRFAEAETYHREALAIRKKLFGETSAETSESLRNVVPALRGQRKNAQATELIRQAVAINRKLGPDANLRAAIKLLAEQLESAGDFAEAAKLYRELLDLWRQTFGEHGG